ncbi:MAG: aldo/keto reductase [Tannerellaceae bacterium]|jgi:diketogulonate reductase-like aldo/keto reductase|nr:aldo/keto reductase [Tannerellaceae bacterium]
MKRRDFIQNAAALAALGAVGNIGDTFGNTLKTTAVAKRELGKTGYKVFPVAYGGIVSMRDGQPASDKYVSWAIDRGINYFDVAPSYEDAQEKLGNSLKPYRKNVYLACKTGRRMRKEAEPEFEKSFELLHTDYFDVYQMHGLSSQKDVDQAFGPGGVLEMMVKAKQDGRVRKLGITAHTEEVALRAMSLYDFDTVMFPVNWMMNMKSGMSTALCQDAKKRGMGILAIKPLIHRRWIDQPEREQSIYPKAWCKPIDAVAHPSLGVAAVKYTFGIGPDVVVPPGDFRSFSFVVDHIDEIVNRPVSESETALLKKEFEQVKDYPFFG